MEKVAEPKRKHSAIQKWGGIASFLIVLSFVPASWFYLTGKINDPIGRLAYDLADFLFGPVMSTSLIAVVYVLRELIGKRAFRRMDLALLAVVISATGMAAVAFIRASNRHYHLLHPELSLENSTTVLLIWDTLVTGMSSLGFHFLGWTLILFGSANWTARIFPRFLNWLYFIAGAASIFVYLLDDLKGLVFLLGAIICIWQGVLLLKSDFHQANDML